MFFPIRRVDLKLRPADRSELGCIGFPATGVHPVVLQNENYVMTKLVRTFALALLSTAMACGTAHAGFFEGAINAHFENPTLQGAVYSPGGAVVKSFDNTSSARYSIYGGGSTATVNWGTNAGGPGTSTLNFFGNQAVSVAGDTTFQFGTFTFYNGTSTLESLIFGIDLVLDFIPTGSSLAVDTLRMHIGIGTSENTGDAHANADYIGIPGVGNSFFVFEGAGGTSNLNGKIVGDPYFSPESFSIVNNFIVYVGPSGFSPPYDPADYLTFTAPDFVGGFVGPTPSATPEPGSLALLMTGVCSVIGVRTVRRKRKQS